MWEDGAECYQLKQREVWRHATLLSKKKKKKLLNSLFSNNFNKSIGTKTLVHLHRRAASTRAKAFMSPSVGESLVPPYNVIPDS